MKFGFNEVCLQHDTGPRHPETADRLLAIKRGLARMHDVTYVSAEAASIDAVTAIHDEAYVEAVRTFCANGGGKWDSDTIAVEDTWDAALASAGLAIWAGELALSGSQGRKTPFSLGRPPGHHAVFDNAMGFCFFNNAAIAAQSVISSGQAARVAIVDWDVHHGNGIQDIFYDRDEVFYASIHEGGLYPGTGSIEEIGVDDGVGWNLNIPLPAGAGDAAYTTAIDLAIAPILVEFDPDLLLVSAGFDAHRRDPISRLTVTTDGYGHMALRLREIVDEVDGTIAFVLEGGYGLDTLADGVSMVHDVFDGHIPLTPDGPVSDQTQTILESVRDHHGIGS